MNTNTNTKQPQPKTPSRSWETLKYCPECGVTKAHLVQQRGAWEYHTCSNCGYQSSYKVR